MTIPETVPEVDLLKVAESHMGEGGLFVYDRFKVIDQANELIQLDLPYGKEIRYAAKANHHPKIIKALDIEGLHFDASSVNEAGRLLRYGVNGNKISLSSQNLHEGALLTRALREGVLPVATSLRQLEMLGGLGCRDLAVRINPGIGSGHNNRTNVGGSSSSFGIWHEQLPEVVEVAKAKKQVINRLHTHIGSGADPTIWRSVIQKSLGIVERLPDVRTLDIGGGYKIGRMPGEESTDIQEVAKVFSEELEIFADRTGRKIKLELEPGTYIVANAGVLLGRVEEMAHTDKYNFLKLNVGMNAILRPSLYGAQHPIEVLNDSDEQEDYVIVGPCCESGDILTPAPGDPEGILPRRLNKAEVGDYVAIGGAGAYCETMSASSYNDIAPATEIVL